VTAPERAPLGAALALLLALVSLTGALSPLLMAISIALLGLLIGIAWPELLELPSPRGTRLVVAGTGIGGALVAILVPERLTPVSALVMLCAIGVFASFVHQMLRRDRRDLTSSLTGTVAGVFLAGLAASWVIAQGDAQASGSAEVVTAVAAGLAAPRRLGSTPLPARPRRGVSGRAGAALTGLLAVSLAGLALPIAAALGAATAIGASSAHLLVGSSLVAHEPVPSLAVAAVPVATVGVLSHLAITLFG
jgi:hypothetical protein